MTSKERIKNQRVFDERTSIIHDKLLQWLWKWKIDHQRPSKKLILQEWRNFMNLAEKVAKDGIANKVLFQLRGREMLETFKLFQEIIPEFELL